MQKSGELLLQQERDAERLGRGIPIESAGTVNTAERRISLSVNNRRLGVNKNRKPRQEAKMTCCRGFCPFVLSGFRAIVLTCYRADVLTI